MLIEGEILETLCCPLTGNPLRMMTERELAALNGEIAQGRVRYSSGAGVAGTLEGGLTTSDGASVFGIRECFAWLLPSLRITPRGEYRAPVADGRHGAVSGSYDESWEALSLGWDRVGPPQRPSRNDIETLERLVAAGVGSRRGPSLRVLLLGVTPEIATMRWPAGTGLLALDNTPGMIRNVWPARRVARGVAVLADWTAMPVRDSAYDLAVGDASLTTMPYPDGFAAVAAELRRVLADGAALVMREFARPEESEPLDAIFRDLHEGREISLSFFTWRLAMAVHGDLESGCDWSRVWDAWCRYVPDPDALMRSLGWPPEASRFLEALREVKRPALFPTLDEMREAFAREFDQVACHVPDYEDGERYPTVVFKPKARSTSSPGASS